MCETPFGEQLHSRASIPEFNKPAACESSYSICCPGALCSDSLVSMESASESASLDLSNISVAADQGIYGILLFCDENQAHEHETLSQYSKLMDSCKEDT